MQHWLLPQIESRTTSNIRQWPLPQIPTHTRRWPLPQIQTHIATCIITTVTIPKRILQKFVNTFPLLTLTLLVTRSTLKSLLTNSKQTSSQQTFIQGFPFQQRHPLTVPKVERTMVKDDRKFFFKERKTWESRIYSTHQGQMKFLHSFLTKLFLAFERRQRPVIFNTLYT
jgi:hypothetical protein